MIFGFGSSGIKPPQYKKQRKIDQQHTIHRQRKPRLLEDIKLQDHQGAQQDHDQRTREDLGDIYAPYYGHGPASVFHIPIHILDVFDDFPDHRKQEGKTAVHYRELEQGRQEPPIVVVCKSRPIELRDIQHQDHPGREQRDNDVSDEHFSFECSTVEVQQDHAAKIADGDERIADPPTYIKAQQQPESAEKPVP